MYGTDPKHGRHPARSRSGARPRSVSRARREPHRNRHASQRRCAPPARPGAGSPARRRRARLARRGTPLTDREPARRRGGVRAVLPRRVAAGHARRDRRPRLRGPRRARREPRRPRHRAGRAPRDDLVAVRRHRAPAAGAGARRAARAHGLPRGGVRPAARVTEPGTVHGGHRPAGGAAPRRRRTGDRARHRARLPRLLLRPGRRGRPPGARRGPRGDPGARGGDAGVPSRPVALARPHGRARVGPPPRPRRRRRDGGDRASRTRGARGGPGAAAAGPAARVLRGRGDDRPAVRGAGRRGDVGRPRVRRAGVHHRDADARAAAAPDPGAERGRAGGPVPAGGRRGARRGRLLRPAPGGRGLRPRGGVARRPRRRVRQGPGGRRPHRQDPQHAAGSAAAGGRPQARAGTAERDAAERRVDPLRDPRAGVGPPGGRPRADAPDERGPHPPADRAGRRRGRVRRHRGLADRGARHDHLDDRRRAAGSGRHVPALHRRHHRGLRRPARRRDVRRRPAEGGARPLRRHAPGGPRRTRAHARLGVGRHGPARRHGRGRHHRSPALPPERRRGAGAGEVHRVIGKPVTGSAPSRGPVLGACAEALWDAVTAGDEYAAADAIATAVERGADAETVLLDIIAPSQARVGREWAANRLTVAQEHTATAINERAIAALAHHPAVREVRERRAGRPHGRVAVACIDGEWHALPARILAEVLRLRGWQVDYLGAQVPTPHLISHVHRTNPAVVALSSSIATRLPAAHAAITACQATGTPVLVGGAAFGADGRYAALLGADGWAPDARAAAGRLAESPLPKPPPVHHAIDDLPHLADQEYTQINRTARRLVRHVMDELPSRFPAMAGYTEQQLRHTAEDIAHIVDFLGTALYVDDPGLFTGFISWTAGILTARGVPARSLLPGLDLLAEQLVEYPRAADLLSRARDALMQPLPDADVAAPS
ncbi:hypothetical protein GWI34_04410 [Actinomadura sp. DSM 109109]|nr:hypothetical protein [Actinomadura lepetitiana]